MSKISIYLWFWMKYVEDLNVKCGLEIMFPVGWCFWPDFNKTNSIPHQPRCYYYYCYLLSSVFIVHLSFSLQPKWSRQMVAHPDSGSAWGFSSSLLLQLWRESLLDLLEKYHEATDRNCCRTKKIDLTWANTVAFVIMHVCILTLWWI